MEEAIKALPDDKSQITFLFDRTGNFILFNSCVLLHKNEVLLLEKVLISILNTSSDANFLAIHVTKLLNPERLLQYICSSNSLVMIAYPPISTE